MKKEGNTDHHKSTCFWKHWEIKHARLVHQSPPTEVRGRSCWSLNVKLQLRGRKREVKNESETVSGRASKRTESRDLPSLGHSRAVHTSRGQKQPHVLRWVGVHEQNHPLLEEGVLSHAATGVNWGVSGKREGKREGSQARETSAGKWSADASQIPRKRRSRTGVRRAGNGESCLAEIKC